MYNKIKVFDIDGLLVDSSHRYRTGADGKIDLPYWRAKDNWYFIMQDKNLPFAEYYKKCLADDNIYVIIATARACVLGDGNYHYIKFKLGMPNRFIHRQGEGDNRGGAALKIAGIKPILNLKQFRNCKIDVYEDNSDYLRDITHAMRDSGHECVGHFNPSYQGH